MHTNDVKTHWYSAIKEIQLPNGLTIIENVRRVLVNNARCLRFFLIFCLFIFSVILSFSLLSTDKETQYIPNLPLKQVIVETSAIFDQEKPWAIPQDPTYLDQQNRINEVCQSKSNKDLQTAVHPESMKHIYVNDKYRFLYCEVPKVACTNFKAMMILLNGEMNTTWTDKLQPYMVHGDYQKMYLRKLSNYTAAEISHRINNYYKFMFVREPLERVLSAYRNKFAVDYNDYFNVRFGRQIIRKYRKHPTKQALLKGNDVTFKEFVKYLTDPIFVKKMPFNAHWQHYYKLCLPCQIQYNFVGKYEHLKEDAEKVLHDLGIEKLIHFPKTKPHSKTTGGVVKTFFKNITSHEVHRLWKLYSVDYQMFGYNYPNVHG